MEKEKRIRNYGKVKKQIEAFFVAREKEEVKWRIMN